MNTIAPPGGLVLVAESIPCTVSYNFQGAALTPTGLAAVVAAVGAYLTAAKKTAIGAEHLRVGGTTAVPAAVLTSTHGTFPVLWADATAQAAALVTLIGNAGNAG